MMHGNGLNGKNIVSLGNLSGHEKSNFSHALGALAALGAPLGDLALTRAVAELLLELIAASLALLLEALDNVNGATNMSEPGLFGTGQAVGLGPAAGLNNRLLRLLRLPRLHRHLAHVVLVLLVLLMTEDGRRSGQRLGVRQTRLEREGLEPGTTTVVKRINGRSRGRDNASVR